MNAASAGMILLCVFFSSIQNVLRKQYSLKSQGGSLTFNTMTVLFAGLFFLVTSGNMQFDLAFVPYSILFALSYSTAIIGVQLAISCGSLALSSLITNYSLVLPTLYGLVVLKEPAGAAQYGGLLMLAVSLYLVRGSEEQEGTIKVTPKWLISVALAFVGNGMCSVTQKAQQTAFDGVYNGPFMLLALGISAVAMFAAAWILERKEIKETFRKGVVYAGLCGISNGIVNYLAMVIVAFVAASIFFPVLTAGLLVITFLISVFLYKEKFIPRQIAGLVLGIFALVLLNL